MCRKSKGECCLTTEFCSTTGKFRIQNTIKNSSLYESRRSTNCIYSNLKQSSDLMEFHQKESNIKEDESPYFKGINSSVISETSCTYNCTNDSLLKSTGMIASYKNSENTTPTSFKNGYKSTTFKEDSLFSFSNLSMENKAVEKGVKKIKIISKEKLSNRAKTILKLENIIKQLRDPSISLSKVQVEGDSKYCKSLRRSIRDLAEQLKSFINDKRLSVESLSTMLESLKDLDQNYQSKGKSTKEYLNEIHVYIISLSKLCQQLISSKINKNRKSQASIRPSTPGLAIENLKQRPSVKDKSELEKNIVKLCDNYKVKSMNKKQVILGLRQLIYNYEQKFLSSQDKDNNQISNKQKWKNIEMMFNQYALTKSSPLKVNISTEDLTISDFKDMKLNSQTKLKLSELISKTKAS